MPVLNDAYNLQFGGQQVLRVMHRDTAVWLVPVPANTVAPVVTGGTSSGSVLSCTPGTWTHSPTGYRYQWQEQVAGVWTNLFGQTASTYTTDHAGEFRCLVTAYNGLGDAENPAASNLHEISAGGTGFFGIQTVGDNGYPASDDRYVAARFYLDKTATITEIVAYTVGSGGDLRGVIWNDAAGEPGSVAVVGGQVTPAAASWRTSVVPGGGVTLAPGWYYIGVVTGGYYSSLRHNLASGNAMRANNGGNYDVPGTWPGSGTFNYASLLSVYANYTY